MRLSLLAEAQLWPHIPRNRVGTAWLGMSIVRVVLLLSTPFFSFSFFFLHKGLWETFRNINQYRRCKYVNAARAARKDRSSQREKVSADAEHYHRSKCSYALSWIKLFNGGGQIVTIIHGCSSVERTWHQSGLNGVLRSNLSFNFNDVIYFLSGDYE